MRKLLLIFGLFTLIALTGHTQTVMPNGGFENWVNVGQNTETPQYYNSNKDGGGYATSGPQTCFQSTTAHSGTYSVEIQSETYIFNIVVNGSCTTGEVEAPSTNKADGYLWSQGAPYNSQYCVPFSGRPDSITFWYQYTSVGGDQPSVTTRLHIGNCYVPETPSNSNHPDSTVNIIARADWTGPATNLSSWTYVAIPFTYVDGRTPAFIMINMTPSSNQAGGNGGSTMWVDDLNLVYNPTIATGTVSTGPYYVSATQGTSITVPFTLSGPFNGANTVTAQLSDMNGSFASPVTLGSVNATTSGSINGTIPANTATGTGYRVRVVSSNPALTATDNGSNITIDLCSNSTAPATAQYIQDNTNGTAITVTETPAATSREWQYGTQPGGPYSSFIPAQTGASYTPNFPLPGTYYVVCQSTYPGSLTVTSNEVIVYVYGNGISPTAIQSILVNTNGNTLTVTDTAAANSWDWQYSTVSGGPYSPFIVDQTGSTYTPNFSTPGVYYVVCVSSYNGGLNIISNQVEIIAAETSVTPSAAQNILVATNGNTLTVNETPSANSREWYYATTSGGPYQAFGPVQNGGSYVPNFNSTGIYYVICVSSFAGGLNDTSNEVVINVVANSIAPATSQSILVGVNGTMLTVTETPAGTSRDWQYATVSGGPYSPFIVDQTGMTYTPNFASAGSYYVVCISIIDGVTATSNEVLISVGTATITTGTILGSPYLFSPNSPNASVNVPYTTNGTFNPGNTFTAQLSDASGAFGSPTNIGTFADTTSGTIAATILNTTPAGNGYRIRVVSDNPPITGSDNGVNLVVDQFNNSIAPTGTQTITYNTNGTPLTVTASQTSTQNWEFSTVSGGPYASFIAAQTGTTYTPNFAAPGTYYVVCVSTNQWGDSAVSNEVQIVVQNGNSITTLTVTGSPFDVSPNAVVPVTVNFTSDAVFNAGNSFMAQLSDATGSFASPVTIGTITTTTIGPIASMIPDNSITGSGYRIRVVSTNPAITGSDNGADLTIDQFSNNITPAGVQILQLNTNGNLLTVNPSQISNQDWKYTTTSGSGYVNFLPLQTGNTYTPNFSTPGTYYVVCISKNQWSDTVTSNEVEVDISNGNTLTTLSVTGSPYYVSAHAHVGVDVNFTSDAVFTIGNVFTAQLSDQTGSFTSPTTIGTFSADTIGTIAAVIPDNSVAGTQYRIRVISSNPPLTGTDNGTDLTIIPFTITVSPPDTQTIYANQNGNILTATSTHPVVTYNWQYAIDGGIQFHDFAPAQTADTLTPNFTTPQSNPPYYIICSITNGVPDTVTSQEVVVFVLADTSVNINGVEQTTTIKAWWNHNYFVVDLSDAKLVAPTLQLFNVAGQELLNQELKPAVLNTVPTSIPGGIYLFRISDQGNTYNGKTSKR